jgi:hypothetical protein
MFTREQNGKDNPMLSRTLLLKCLTLVFVLLIISTALPAADNPLIGTWKSNPSKSKNPLGPPNTGNLNKYEASGANGIKYTSDRTDAKGQTAHFEFTANFDGKTYPYKGPGTDRDGVALKRIDPYTYQVSYKKGGETIQINYWIVSKDGKTITTVSTGVGANNQVYSRLVVADKQ